MNLERKMSSICKQAAVLRYILIPAPLGGQHLVLVPVGQRLQAGQIAWFKLNQN